MTSPNRELLLSLILFPIFTTALLAMLQATSVVSYFVDEGRGKAAPPLSSRVPPKPHRPATAFPVHAIQ